MQATRRVLSPGVITGIDDLFRTATHHNMMLDPAILCSSLQFVNIALTDVGQLRRFLISAYYTTGVKVAPPPQSPP
jgi:hypothetical protein